MMEKEIATTALSIADYNSICNTVMDYIQGFQNENPEVQRNFVLKQDHIHRVIGYTELISRSIATDEDILLMVQLAALLHDIGRFEQYERYETFNDAISVDHAELGIQIIEKNGWLSSLPGTIPNIIKQSILLHNKIAIPKQVEETTLLITKILRDADKLDILDLSSQDYQQSQKKQNGAITLGLEATSFVAKSIEKSLQQKRLPNRKEMSTVTEFKLMQMAYVFDINFKESFAVINKKGFIKKIFDTLPKSDIVFETYRNAKIHVENHLI